MEIRLSSPEWWRALGFNPQWEFRLWLHSASLHLAHFKHFTGAHADMWKNQNKKYTFVFWSNFWICMCRTEDDSSSFCTFCATSNQKMKKQLAAVSHSSNKDNDIQECLQIVEISIDSVVILQNCNSNILKNYCLLTKTFNNCLLSKLFFLSSMNFSLNFKAAWTLTFLSSKN